MEETLIFGPILPYQDEICQIKHSYARKRGNGRVKVKFELILPNNCQEKQNADSTFKATVGLG